VAKAVAAIVLSFTLCWIPAEVMDTMDKINPLLLPRPVRRFSLLVMGLKLEKVRKVT